MEMSNGLSLENEQRLQIMFYINSMHAALGKVCDSTIIISLSRAKVFVYLDGDSCHALMSWRY